METGHADQKKGSSVNQLIRYAGYDREELTPDECSARALKAMDTRRKKARRMFKNGKDTMQISEWMCVKEPTILLWITEERNREYAEKHA